MLRYFVYFIIALIGFYLAFKLFNTFVQRTYELKCRYGEAYEQCGDVPDMKTVQIRGGGPEDIAPEIMKYAYACWEKSGNGMSEYDIWCFELYIQNIDRILAPSDILMEASSIPGLTREFVDMEFIDIGPGSESLYIYYNSTSRKVVVR